MEEYAKTWLRDEGNDDEDLLQSVEDYLNEAVSHIDSAIYDIGLLELSLLNSNKNAQESDTTESEKSGEAGNKNNLNDSQ